MLVEWDLARVPRSGQAGHAVWGLLGTLLRQTLVHPVITPVLLGFVWHALLGPLPGPLDDILKLLGSGTVPVCLLLIGLSLSHYGVGGYESWRSPLTLLKTLALPLVVWAFAYRRARPHRADLGRAGDDRRIAGGLQPAHPGAPLPVR